MTDPKESYARKDEMRAVDHDRIAHLYRIGMAFLVLVPTFIFGLGGAYYQLSAHSEQITLLTIEMRAQQRISTRNEVLQEGMAEGIRRIEKRLETLAPD